MNWIKDWMPGKYTHYRAIVRDFVAFRYGREVEPEWYKRLISLGPSHSFDDSEHGRLKVKTPNGWENVPDGAWVTMDRTGQLAWIYHDQFETNYEPTPEYAKLIP